MSTSITTEARWFREGARYGLDGSLGYDAAPLVGRFKFHTPAAGATSLSFASDDYAVYGGYYYYNDPGFRFLVSSEATGYESQVGTGLGTAAAKTWNSAAEKYNLTGSAEVRLMPDTDYYLWIWPNSDLPSRIEPGRVTVTLEGAYGSPSEFSVSDGFFGGQVPISISPAATGAVHDLTVSCAGRTVKLLDKSAAVSRVWQPALSTYAPLLPNAGSAAASFTLETFYGGVSVGTRSASITLRFAEGSLPPTLSEGWAAASAYNAGTPAAGLSVYVQGLSRAELSFDTSKIACRYGASAASFSIRCGGVTVRASPYRSGVLTGDAQIVCTVTDSRGQSASETISVSTLPYAAPRLTEITVFRCDGQGTEAEDGAYCSVKARALYSDLGGHNSVTLTAALKPGGGSYGTENALQNNSASILGGLSPTGSCTVRLTATDALGSVAAATVLLPGERWAMKFRPDGRGVAFGMAPEYSDCLQLPAGWKIRIGDTVVAG